MSDRALITLCLVPGVVLVVGGLVLFSSAGRDDAHITYWPAYTLAHHGRIVNYNGERVEQSSSLFQVVLLAMLAKVTGAGVVVLGKLSSIAGGVAALFGLTTLTTRVSTRPTAFLAALLTALAAPFMYWTYGGMETTLVAALGIFLVLALADYCEGRSSIVRPAIAIALFVMVRPETPLLLGAMLIAPAALLRGRVAQIFGVFVVIAAVLFAFRLWYFGSAFPQPVAAKSTGLTMGAVVSGLKYLKRTIGDDPLAQFVAVSAAISVPLVVMTRLRARRLDTYLLFAALYVWGYGAFVVLAGGDWMEGGRLLVGCLPVALMFLAIAAADFSLRPQFAVVAATVLLLVQVKVLVDFSRTSSMGLAIWNEVAIPAPFDASRYSWFETRNRVNARDILAAEYLGRFADDIGRRNARPVVVLTGQMGLVPYHAVRERFGKLRFIDRKGLADRYLTTCELTRGGARDAGGLSMLYDEYFAKIDALERTCGVPRPDIVVDLVGLDSSEEQLAARGFTVMFAQSGDVGGSGFGYGDIVEARVFVAVRNDLVPAIGTPVTRVRFAG